MKLFISLIASFFLIVGCGGKDDEEPGAGDDTVVGDGENPEANEADGETEAGATENPEANVIEMGYSTPDSNPRVFYTPSNSALVACFPYRIGATFASPTRENILELTQPGEFDCPQEAPHNCSRCELLEDAYLGLAISLECTSSGGSVYFPVENGNGTVIRQIGMSCTKITNNNQ